MGLEHTAPPYHCNLVGDFDSGRKFLAHASGLCASEVVTERRSLHIFQILAHEVAAAASPNRGNCYCGCALYCSQSRLSEGNRSLGLNDTFAALPEPTRPRFQGSIVFFAYLMDEASAQRRA